MVASQRSAPLASLPDLDCEEEYYGADECCARQHEAAQQHGWHERCTRVLRSAGSALRRCVGKAGIRVQRGAGSVLNLHNRCAGREIRGYAMLERSGRPRSPVKEMLTGLRPFCGGCPKLPGSLQEGLIRSMRDQDRSLEPHLGFSRAALVDQHRRCAESLAPDSSDDMSRRSKWESQPERTDLHLLVTPRQRRRFSEYFSFCPFVTAAGSRITQAHRIVAF